MRAAAPEKVMTLKISWLIPGLLLLLGLTLFYHFGFGKIPELEERYMIAYCRYLCKKAILEGKAVNGIVLSEIYKEVKIPVASKAKGEITAYKTLTWKWDYACCIGDCNYPKKIILDENCTFVKKVG